MTDLAAAIAALEHAVKHQARVVLRASWAKAILGELNSVQDRIDAAVDQQIWYDEMGDDA